MVKSVPHSPASSTLPSPHQPFAPSSPASSSLVVSTPFEIPLLRQSHKPLPLQKKAFRTSSTAKSHSSMLPSRILLPPSVPSKPLTSNSRDYWRKLLPAVPEDDRCAQLHQHVLAFTEEQKNALVGNHLAWGSHVVHLGSQSNSPSLRYIYWARIISYRHKTKKSYPELVPGLLVDEYSFCTSQSLDAPFPTVLRSPSSLPSLKTLLQK